MHNLLLIVESARVVDNYQGCMYRLDRPFLNNPSKILLSPSLKLQKSSRLYSTWIISLPGIESKVAIFAKVLRSFSWIC